MAEAYGLVGFSVPKALGQAAGQGSAHPVLGGAQLCGSTHWYPGHIHTALSCVLMGGTCSQRTQPRRVEMARPKPHRETHLWTGL